ncbi:MAG TPA: TIGR02757 family protein, partial [Elusimicrobia bacterium]|nr:TIGR02757 family protein [Elusimicrobiota bacterium]
KRLNLFLRWMVRQDEVDPGGWKQISPAKLLVPLDVHMHRIAQKLGLTKRNAADITAVLEIST